MCARLWFFCLLHIVVITVAIFINRNTYRKSGNREKEARIEV